MNRREPIFNVPPVVAALIGSFVLVHLVRALLPAQEDDWLTAVLAFVPARLTGIAGQLPGGDPAAVTQFVTHIFVHGDLMHLILNSAWLLPFGSSVARRVGSVRFLLFFLLCGIGGALSYALLSPNPLSMMVGASGAISGLMGAAFRFLFKAIRDQDADGLAGLGRKPPLMSLRATLQDRRIVLAIIGWTLLNIAMAWGAVGLADGVSIAWEAHIGGFFVGLLTFGWFDPPEEADPNAAPAA